MDLDVKIKCSLLIFTLIINIYIISGCEYQFQDCYTDVYCSTGRIDWGQVRYHRYGDNECSNNKFYVNERYIYPLRLKIGSKYATELFIDEMIRNNSYYKSVVSLEITNIALTTTPYFNEMFNLKMLNLSNNHLDVAKLFNRADLNSLTDVDLSHNYIISIQVDNNQWVYKSINKLNLSNNLLTHIPGAIFDSFKYLENLDLSHNKIVSIDHYTFEGLRNLKYFYLSYNNISDIGVSFFRFSYLEELYLDNNNIVSLSIRNFEKLKNLRTLNLDFNKISNIAKDTFSNTESLTTLKLHHNLLRNINKDTFILTNHLEIIDLSNNLIESLPNNLLINKNISSFSITGNNLQAAITRGTFEGLHLITELDVSRQAITAVEELAFFGLAKLTTLLLNNNEIRTISNQSFNTLISLKQLDLSNNLILNIDFSKSDLVSLEIFSLSNNFINQILRENLQDLIRLRFLDISNNNISKLETGSFKTIQTIENLQLFNNPISGPLLKNSFAALILVPVLDLSNTLLTFIQNGSFSGMVQLQELNISRGSINKLEYGAFMNTGNIKSIDLSFNKLTEFVVNGNDLRNLTTVHLNNNAIFQISNYVFQHMNMLSKIILSFNLIQNVSDKSFADQTDLRYLDVSFNTNLTFHVSAINNSATLEKLLLSGVKNVVEFRYISTVPINKLELTHLGIHNISMLHLNSMRHLNNLAMSNNNITKLEFSALRNMSALEWLDLSFNNISFIQPSSFKENVFLHSLNLSHNSLTSINYGIFRGLVSLNLLDISYNSISDLGRERFYNTPSMKVLIADHNRISDVNTEYFGINLELLSIGHNPLPCEKIVLLKEFNRFKVSAVDIDENNGDNIDGIACNMNNHNKIPELRPHATNFNTTTNERILVDIRDILLSSLEKRGLKMPSGSVDIDLLNKLEKYSINQTIQLQDIKTELGDEINRTNSFLERILKVILGFGSFQSKLAGDNVNDTTSNNNNLTHLHNDTLKGYDSKLDTLVSDVNRLKQELLYMENVISEKDRKMSLGRTLYMPSTLENLNKSDHGNVTSDNASKSFIFLEVCVSLILLMLLCLFLYRFYKAKILQQPRSLSTRHITDAMDNSNL